MPPQKDDQTVPQADRPALVRDHLDRGERDDFDRRIVERVTLLNEVATRPVGLDWDVANGVLPHPRNRWIFPSVAYSRGGTYARDFNAAMKSAGLENLRLVTLRFGDAKPTQGGLAQHLKLLSQAVNNSVGYLVRRGIAQPQLSAIHIRFDEATARLDPHIHGIWDIPPGLIVRAKELLQRRFSGVWIDEGPIQRASHAAFYVCRNIVHHRSVSDWPLNALAEVWRLAGRQHYVRPAGAYAAWIRAHRDA